MMKSIKSFSRILDLHTYVVMLLSIISTWACYRFGFQADMPTGLIGIAIIFPIVFSINSAYKRREEALKSLADFKGNAISIFLAHRDWPQKETKDDDVRVSLLFKELFQNTRAYFEKGNADNLEMIDRVYDSFSDISKENEILRNDGLPAGLTSRINQYMRGMIIDFERMRNILRYRTPKSLRSYSKIFLNIFPVLFGPYFAQLALENNLAIGYIVAIMYSLVLVSLDNIQEDLENPFDLIGEDDLDFSDFQEIVKRVMGLHKS